MRKAQMFLNPRALKQNLTLVQQLAPNSKVVAMVKANAYGHGIEWAARTLLASPRPPEAFGVACLEEGQQLESAGIRHPTLLVEGVFSSDEWKLLAGSHYHCAIHSEQQLHWALQHPTPDVPVWVKLNSGMNRLGFTVDATVEAIRHLCTAGYRVIVFSHFANADQPEFSLNDRQWHTLQHLTALFPELEWSCCNSAALIQWPERQGHWVRPGIMLYGSSPFGMMPPGSIPSLKLPPSLQSLQPVMQLQAQLIAIHTLSAGDTVGYGSLWKASQTTPIGIVGIGYGDGYPRVVAGAEVGIGGQRAPVIGRVSMDMLAVDLGGLNELPVMGSPVELWGDTVSVDQIAAAANTIGYELLCKITARVERISERTSEIIRRVP